FESGSQTADTSTFSISARALRMSPARLPTPITPRRRRSLAPAQAEEVPRRDAVARKARRVLGMAARIIARVHARQTTQQSPGGSARLPATSPPALVHEHPDSTLTD